MTDYFADKGQRGGPRVQRDESGVFATDKTEIFAVCAHLYDPLTERWPFLPGRSAAPSPPSTQTHERLGLHRISLPAGGESTLNVDSPAVFLPVTIAHELATSAA